MSKNKPATKIRTLRIGSRMRWTDRGEGQGMEGRIVWANAVSFKIEWADGEKATWRRDKLAELPIEILDTKGDEDGQPTSAEPAPGRQEGGAKESEAAKDALKRKRQAKQAAGGGRGCDGSLNTKSPLD